MHGVARRLALQDMEFVQFHPTGIYGAGMLITEGSRGEGGYLDQFRRRALHGTLCAECQRPCIQGRGQPFDDRLKFGGRGVGTEKDHIHLHLEHLALP